MTGTLIILACVCCFAAGLVAGAHDGQVRVGQIKKRNDELHAGIDYWIEQYEQAGAIARAVVDEVTPPGRRPGQEEGSHGS